MESRNLITIAWFLVCIAQSCSTPTAQPDPNCSLSSVYRRAREQINNCGDHLIKININQCRMNGQCEAHSNGASTTSENTRFTIFDKNGKKCIQYIDSDNNRTPYALKAITQEGKLVFENHSCETTDVNFLFEEVLSGKENHSVRHVVYTPIVNNTMCVGVTEDCSVNLALISPGDINENLRCRFDKLYNSEE